MSEASGKERLRVSVTEKSKHRSQVQRESREGREGVRKTGDRENISKIKTNGQGMHACKTERERSKASKQHLMSHSCQSSGFI